MPPETDSTEPQAPLPTELSRSPAPLRHLAIPVVLSPPVATVLRLAWALHLVDQLRAATEMPVVTATVPLLDAKLTLAMVLRPVGSQQVITVVPVATVPLRAEMLLPRAAEASTTMDRWDSRVVQLGMGAVEALFVVSAQALARAGMPMAKERRAVREATDRKLKATLLRFALLGKLLDTPLDMVRDAAAGSAVDTTHTVGAMVDMEAVTVDMGVVTTRPQS